MIGVPEEMMTVVEGEAWMMGHVVARTPNHGSPSVDLVRLHHQINSFAFNSSVGEKRYALISVHNIYSSITLHTL